jgi:hypothetical protein
MRTLNKNGIKKLNDYINSEYGNIFQACDNRLFGPKSDEIFEDLKKHGIIFEEIVFSESSSQSSGPNINYRVMVEDTPISSVAPLETPKTSITPSPDTGINYEDDKKIKELVSKIIPHLSNHFPTKEETNNALNDLRSQLIDPEKLQALFKDMSSNLKKTEEKKI